MEHHSLDSYLTPKDKMPLYIDELWLIGESICRELGYNREPESEDDNIRVFIPLDLNKKLSQEGSMVLLCIMGKRMKETNQPFVLMLTD